MPQYELPVSTWGVWYRFRQCLQFSMRGIRAVSSVGLAYHLPSSAAYTLRLLGWSM